jgi:excisionase family DNA binding protein
MLGVSVFTIRRLIARGEVLAVNVGARRLVRSTEIDRIVQRGVGKPRTAKMNRKQR